MPKIIYESHITQKANEVFEKEDLSDVAARGEEMRRTKDRTASTRRTNTNKTLITTPESDQQKVTLHKHAMRRAL